MRRLLPLLTVAGTLALAAPAGALLELPHAAPSVAHNPADALASRPIEPFGYDPATHCSARPRPGMTRFVRWMQTHARGESWGTYRGAGQAR